MAAKPFTRRTFTGRHAFLAIAGGFAVVFAVNGIMAYFAINNQPGLIVEDSYVAGQQFNDGLEQGRAQARLGWTFEAGTSNGRLLLEARDSRGQPLVGLSGEVTLSHPYGSEPATILPLVALGDGRYSAGPVGAGRQVAEIRTRRGGQQHYQQIRLEPER